MNGPWRKLAGSQPRPVNKDAPYEELIDIRKGKIDLQSLIDHVEKEIKEVDKLFKESNLPESVDKDFVNNLIIKIRKEVYNKLINKI